jgi:hypothetical protein
VGEGEFRFGVTQRQLKEGLETVGLTTSRDPPFDKIKVTLYRELLMLQTINRDASFSEIKVLLIEPSPSIPAEQEKDQAPAFVFSHEQLLRIVSSLPEELAFIEFTFAVAEQMLRFQTADPDDPAAFQKNFQLTCWPISDFSDYHRQDHLANARFVGRVDATKLRRAIEYTAIFPAEREPQTRLNMIELHDGTMVAGTQQRMVG